MYRKKKLGKFVTERYKSEEMMYKRKKLAIYLVK